MKKVDEESFLHDKVCVLKKPSFAKATVYSLIMSELKIFLWLTQAQILQCKYLEIKELQRSLLEKWFMTKFFLNFFTKRPFFYLKIVAPPKQIMSHKSVHWYQCISLWKMLGGEY